MGNTKERKKFKPPHLLTIMFGMIVVASILTYLVPAGTFDRDPETNQFIGSTFHFVEQTPVSLWKSLFLIQDGLVGTAAISMNLLYVGGLMGVFLATKAIDKTIMISINKLKDKGVIVMIPAIMFIMSLIGAFGANDTFAAFTVVGVVLAAKLKLDPIIAVMALYGASYIGFATGPNMIIKTAQLLADIPMYSGFTMRMIIWFIMTAIAIIYTVRYCKKIIADPSKSYMGSRQWYDDLQNANTELSEDQVVAFDWKAVFTTVVFMLTFVVTAWGMITQGYSLGFNCVVMTITALFCALVIYRMDFDTLGKAFAKGVADVAFICVIIGLAKVVSLILDQGQVLNTLVYYCSLPLASMGKGLATIMMFVFNTLFNFLIPSGSGQAAVVMPLMVPMTDVLGIERQVMCTAFSLGDGLSNLLWPTVGVTMGALSIAGVSYDKWLKFIGPLFAWWTLATSIILFILGTIGWTGMGII